MPEQVEPHTTQYDGYRYEDLKEALLSACEIFSKARRKTPEVRKLLALGRAAGMAFTDGQMNRALGGERK